MDNGLRRAISARTYFLAAFTTLLVCAVCWPFFESAGEFPIEDNQNAVTGITTRELESFEKEVTTYEDLETYLKDSETTVIYLGANITQPNGSGITINPAKTSLVIDGVSPLDETGTVHTFQDASSSDSGWTLSLRSNTGLKDITLRNMVVDGANYYGPIYITDDVKNATITYDNVHYTGPQLTFNRYGTAVYHNTEVYITQNRGGSPANEVGEVSQIVLDGKVILEKLQNTDNEIFYSILAGEIRVKSGAYVRASTPNVQSGFLYSATSNIDFVMEKNAYFEFTGPGRFFEINCFKNATFEESSQFYCTIDSMTGNAMFHVQENMTVGDNAIVHLVAKGGTYAALRIETGKLEINNPKSFLVSSGAIRPLVFGTANNLVMRGQQINYWRGAGESSLDNPPLYQWRQGDGSDLDVIASVSAGASGVITDFTENYAPAEDEDNPPPALNAANFNLNTMRMLSVGRLDVTGDYEPVPGGINVFGNTDSFAALVVDLLSGNDPYVAIRTAAEDDGSYKVFTDDPSFADTEVEVRANILFLFTETSFVVEPRGLQFQTEPEDIRFPRTVISPHSVLVARSNNPFTITVSDGRGEGSKWSLQVMLVQPLTPGTGAPAYAQPLERALVYVADNGQETVLTDDPFPVASGETAILNEVTDIVWQQNAGVMARIAPGTALAGVKYTGAVRWVLIDAP